MRKGKASAGDSAAPASPSRLAATHPNSQSTRRCCHPLCQRSVRLMMRANTCAVHYPCLGTGTVQCNSSCCCALYMSILFFAIAAVDRHRAKFADRFQTLPSGDNRTPNQHQKKPPSSSPSVVAFALDLLGPVLSSVACHDFSVCLAGRQRVITQTVQQRNVISKNAPTHPIGRCGSW